MAMTSDEITSAINSVFPDVETFTRDLQLFKVLGNRTVLEETIAKKRQDQAAANQAAEADIQSVSAQLATVQAQITNSVG